MARYEVNCSDCKKPVKVKSKQLQQFLRREQAEGVPVKCVECAAKKQVA